MKTNNYDLIVIGAGAAGMMAALSAAYKGNQILIIEKNSVPGKKISITGKGRCNITTSNTNTNEFIQKFGKNGKFLYSALNQFSIQDTIDFFNNTLKIKTKVERGNRIFPVSDDAKEITDTFHKFLNAAGVTFHFNTKVTGFECKNNRINNVCTSIGKFYGKNFLVATGGKSYPKTGSTGDGYKWLKKLGHKIDELQPALTPIICKETFIKD